MASITKQFTAAAILLLEERGRLTIDDQVKKHLPDAPAAWDGMTVFHLLTHTAGFTGLQSPADTRQPPVESADGTVAGFVRALMQRPLESTPGERFNYTNSGYFLLAHLIQTLSGESYEAFVRNNLLAPLGLNDTGLDSASAVIPRRAAAYTVTPGSVINSPIAPSDRIVPNAAAGMYSTTEDLHRWQTALYGGRVLTKTSLQKMTTPFKGDYGLGVYIRTIDGRRAANTWRRRSCTEATACRVARPSALPGTPRSHPVVVARPQPRSRCDEGLSRVDTAAVAVRRGHPPLADCPRVCAIS